MYRRVFATAFVLGLLAAAWMLSKPDPTVQAKRDDNVVMLDDCNPADPAWTSVGGCALKPNKGDVCPNAAATAVLPPGDKTKITSLALGLHKYQCCFHPWTRAAVRVD